ncbi:MAG: alpha/beta hydrolase [Leptolyngbyaceae cyanobacterium CSU_1_3]|nr:alpha/beta hydrolase [Leptolyngbyaceae cyanobacterium CSU_1_3]
MSSLAAPGFAAEKLNLRLGPFEQSIRVADLEKFAQTGEVPSALQLYSPFLTPEFRKVLTSRLQLDPNLGSQVVEEILKSASGKRLLKTLQQASPGLTIEQLQAGFWLAARQANGLDALSVLKAIPQETVTVDVTQAIGVASQVNFSYWKSQAISSQLERSLTQQTEFRATFDPAAPGLQTVDKQTLTLRDQARNRTLPVDIYSSQNPQSPLVVITPGFEANRSFLGYLARHLASHGLTVAAIEHPSLARQGNAVSFKLDQLVPATEFVDRPKDISFVLDQLTQINQESGPLAGKFNTQKVAVVGHSLGGYGALALAGAKLNLDELRNFCQTSNLLQRVPADWLQCAASALPDRQLSLRDKRVVQAIALNPAIGQIFGKSGLTQVATPTLILTSTEDTLAPTFSQQLQPFTQLPKPKYLLTAIGTTHLSVSDPANFSGAIGEGTLVKERRGEEVAPLRQLLQGVSLAFIKQQTSEAKTYETFLTSGYAQSMSTPGLPLRLNTELPANLSRWLKLAAIF